MGAETGFELNGMEPTAADEGVGCCLFCGEDKVGNLISKYYLSARLGVPPSLSMTITREKLRSRSPVYPLLLSGLDSS